MNAHSAVWKRFAHVLIGLAVLLSLSSPIFGAVPIAQAAGPFVVDTLTDGPDSNFGNGSCYDGVDGCSLRAAIQEATADAIPTTITFASGLAGSTWLLDDTYGTILWVGDDITVTGESKNITISGVNLGAGKSIFQIEGSHNHLENLKVKLAPQDGIQVGDFAGTGAGNSNTILNVTAFGNGRAGVYVFGGSNSGGQDNSVASSLIGATSISACGAGNDIGVYVDQGATSTVVTGNTIICNASSGVQISGTTSASLQGNVIGFANNIARPNGGNGVYGIGTVDLYLFGNMISGNDLNGIQLENSSLARIFGNFIGTNASVSTAIPNGGHGVALMDNSDHNAIGDALPGDRNFISGNSSSGILLYGSGTHDNTIAGNYIGTNLAGSAAIANGLNGVLLLNNTYTNTIGGASASVRNLISGNGQAGILIDGSNANTVGSNLIGLNAAGTSALPNGQDGIWINNGASGNNIGSSVVGQAQYIGGNVGTGVLIINSDGNSVFQSNRIGIGPSGTPLGNGDGGVFIIDSSNSLIYPTQVVNNSGAGVAVIGNGSLGNDLGPLHVSANSGLPIDLGNDGPTPNDGVPDIGPNNFLDYPVITASASHVITGTTCDDCTVFVYQALGNPGAPGGGGDYLGSTVASPAGLWSYALPGSLGRFDVTLQAQDLSLNTSEFSPRPILFLPLVGR